MPIESCHPEPMPNSSKMTSIFTSASNYNKHVLTAVPFQCPEEICLYKKENIKFHTFPKKARLYSNDENSYKVSFKVN